MSTRRTPEQVPIVAGVVAGQAAWLVGYLATAVVVLRRDHGAVLASVFGDVVPSPDRYQTVGWVFHSAHGGAIRVAPAARGDPVSAVTATLVGSSGGFTPLLYAVPVVVLVAAGATVAVVGDCVDPLTGLTAGVALVPGYLALAIAAKLATSLVWSMAAGGFAHPTDFGVVVSGVVYPTVCAGAGGMVAGKVRSVTSAASGTRETTDDTGRT